MSTGEEQVEQTTQRLAEVEALQRTLAAVQQELSTYHDLLSKRLTALQGGPPIILPDPVADHWMEPVVAEAEPPAAKPEPPAAKPQAPKPEPPVAKGQAPAPKPAPPAPKPEPTVAAIPVSPAIPIATGATPVVAAVPVHPVKPARSVARLLSSAAEAIRAAGPTRAAKPPAPPSVPEEDEGSAERRGARRRSGNPISVQVVIAETEDEPFQGWVVDRSSGGIRLLVDQAVAADTILSIRPTKAHPSLDWVQVQVKNCRPERNSFGLGCQFLNNMSWSELQVFG